MLVRRHPPTPPSESTKRNDDNDCRWLLLLLSRMRMIPPHRLRCLLLQLLVLLLVPRYTPPGSNGITNHTDPRHSVRPQPTPSRGSGSCSSSAASFSWQSSVPDCPTPTDGIRHTASLWTTTTRRRTRRPSPGAYDTTAVFRREYIGDARRSNVGVDQPEARKRRVIFVSSSVRRRLRLRRRQGAVHSLTCTV